MGKAWFEVTPELITSALHMPENTTISSIQAVMNEFGFPVIQIIVESPDLPEHVAGNAIKRVIPTVTALDYCSECGYPRRMEWYWGLGTRKEK